MSRVVKSPLSHVMESDCQVLDIRQPFVGLKLHGIANWRLTFMERGVITKDSKLEDDLRCLVKN